MLRDGLVFIFNTEAKELRMFRVNNLTFPTNKSTDDMLTTMWVTTTHIVSFIAKVAIHNPNTASQQKAAPTLFRFLFFPNS